MDEKDHVTGRLLEDTRLARDLSLEEAARRTGIPARVLEGLEKEDAARLPGLVYARVLRKKYADYLGLDGRALSEGGRPRERQAHSSNGRPLMVEAREVSKSYQAEALTVHALKDVSLRIEKGALVAVMGPSGCGKTTLLNVLSGLDEIDVGEIFIAGEPLHFMGDADRTGYRARSMGFVFQGFNLMPVLSAVENVELPLLVSGAGVKVARGRALEVLEQVSLADRAHHRPSQLSGGQQQRVAIARALVNEPAIVWADEPTGNLDSDTSKEVLDLLLQLNEENDQTFVVVTHDPGVGSLMDRVIQMRDGRIVGTAGDPEEAVSGT
ncbi:MAG: ABC-type antimicrobial peptide transport system, ATPase component [uncultured Rubrobacteraceae bacterium]|uniref:ABC-type antimicrobial peptide transport system, ATPase component n=1 Tax=uncultured Rubrobacteraceae bacterium TaxID=349277 RepID=A0A6J4PZ66_9ACTN|nr:MAG: ABC-type antimicrobial peptide transport system, ATPase component [uncultured Rubrobacteraceae bacterium]